jgi:peptidoglycan/LPS O-acetylase OafA/YrhL
MLLRMARIFPLHWLVTIILVAVSYNPVLPSKSILNVLLLQSWLPGVLSAPNGVTWTLSVELFFYCSFIYLVRLSTKSIAVLCLVWGSVICACATIVVSKDIQLVLSEWLFLVSPITRLLEFMVGILMFRWASSATLSTRWRTEGISVVLLLGAVAFYSTHKFPDILRYQIIYLPFMAFVIFSFAKGDGVLSAIFQRRPLVLLGEASFALYMVHQPIIQLAYEIYVGRRFSSPELLALMLVVVCVGTSVIVYIGVEYPVHRYLKKKIYALC